VFRVARNGSRIKRSGVMDNVQSFGFCTYQAGTALENHVPLSKEIKMTLVEVRV
jgi:hypothetical protein